MGECKSCAEILKFYYHGKTFGFTGFKHSEEEKERIRETVFRNNPFFGKNHITTHNQEGKKNPNWNGGNDATEARRRNLGFNPINQKFKDSEGHHLTKDIVVYIPTKLHKSVWHSLSKNINMERINGCVLEWASKNPQFFQK